MAKVISQDTFDEVVKENIVDFSLKPDEAREETIKQFEAQGIDLTNIIKDLSINPDNGKPLLNETIDLLKKYIGEKSTDTTKLLESLVTLDEECQKSIAHRVLAAKNGAHESLITLLEQELAADSTAEVTTAKNLDIVKKCLKALISLTNKNPDIFDAEALAIALKMLKIDDENTICLTLQWLQKACIMHEINRQHIVNAGVVKHLKPYVKKDTSMKLVREVLTLFRYLVLDDDIRVEFGCAHEHARQIANEYLVDLTEFLKVYQDPNVLADLFLTIGTIAVRQELCKIIDDAGGIKSTFDLMITHCQSVRLVREALKLVRALAGNDEVKSNLILGGCADVITNVLKTHMSNESVVIPALACVATITLRVSHNSGVFFKAGVAEPIVETMRLHPKNRLVQRNSAWAIRNMVSRSREQCETWLSFGVEDLLNFAMSEHPTIQQDIKAALRDLGCKVELKEEWTGIPEKKIKM